MSTPSRRRFSLGPAACVVALALAFTAGLDLVDGSTRTAVGIGALALGAVGLWLTFSSAGRRAGR